MSSVALLIQLSGWMWVHVFGVILAAFVKSSAVSVNNQGSFNSLSLTKKSQDTQFVWCEPLHAMSEIIQLPVWIQSVFNACDFEVVLPSHLIPGFSTVLKCLKIWWIEQYVMVFNICSKSFEESFSAKNG
jgi:hypothetical protein